MSKYGEVAIRALKLTLSGMSPHDSWEQIVKSMFPGKEASQKKGCPRGAFLGLCQAGLVRGVPAGDYTQSLDNKRYAIRAVELLSDNPSLAQAGPGRLWECVMNGEKKTHNSQMDVVLALWHNGFLIG